MTYNPKIKNTAANKVRIDADLNATNINLGVAEDNDDTENITENPTYQDGLFAFDTETTVGVAIDRINEVLGKIAPKAAKSLNSLNSSQAGSSQYISLEEVGETAVSLLQRTSTDSRKLESVGDKGAFDVILDGNVGGQKYRRLGVFSTQTTLTFILNGTETADIHSTDVTNYPNFAYNTSATKDQDPPIKVYFNGVLLADEDGYTIDNNPKNAPAVFASGETFEPFAHSVTTITLDAVTWRKGHNYVQVVYNDTNTTSYVDWVFAPDEAVSGTPFTFASPSIRPVVTLPDLTNVSNVKHISGVKYISNQLGVTVKPPAGEKINNYALQSFPKDFGVSIDAANVQGKSANGNNFNINNDVSTVNKTINIDNFSTAMASNKRLLGEAISFTLRVNNGLGKTGNKAYTTLDKYMFDSYSSNDGSYTYQNGTQTNTIDTFNHENYRIASSVGVGFVPSTSEPTAWNSAVALSNGDALVYEGRLKHPASLNVQSDYPSQTVNYNALTNEAFYYRKLKKLYAANTKVTFKISGNSVTFGPKTDSDPNKWHIEFQQKNGTWLDACVNNATPGGVAQGTGAAGTVTSSGLSFTIEWNASVNGQAPEMNEIYLMRISIPNGATGYIEQIDITNGG